MTDALVEYDVAARVKPNTGSAIGQLPLTGLAIRHILVPLDGSPEAESVLPYVEDIASAFSARVTLLRAVEVGPDVPGRRVDALEWELARVESHAYLAAVAARLAKNGLTANIELVQGHAAEQILLLARRQAVDVIALATHGHGHAHGGTIGTTVQRVIAGAPTSVLIVPGRDVPGASRGEIRLRRMFLPLDCSQRAEITLPAATDLARRHHAELILAHVVLEPELPRRMGPSQEDLELAKALTERNRRAALRYLRDIQNRLKPVAEQVEVRVCVASRRSQALRELAEREDVDLLILSAHGNTGDAHQRYGGVAAKLLQDCQRPIIMLQDIADTDDDRHDDSYAEAHLGR